MLLARPTVVLLIVLTIRTVFSSQRLEALGRGEEPPSGTPPGRAVDLRYDPFFLIWDSLTKFSATEGRGEEQFGPTLEE